MRHYNLRASNVLLWGEPLRAEQQLTTGKLLA